MVSAIDYEVINLLRFYAKLNKKAMIIVGSPNGAGFTNQIDWSME
jgi:hypothetical protein